MNNTPGGWRPPAVLVTTTLVTAGLARLGLDAAPGVGRADYLHQVTGWAGAALVGCAGWGLLVTVLALTEHVCRLPRIPLVPAGVRRAVLAGCGVALAAAGPAAATGVGIDPGPADPPSLAGLPYPDRALGGPALPHHLHHHSAHPPSAREALLVVRPGDSLWAIAAARSGRPDSASVADDVVRLYRANRDLIGPDPDLIRPGQTLRLPSGWAADRRQEQS